MISHVVESLGACVDDMAFIHNMVGKTGVHSQATYLQATGFQRPGFPGMGAWISYALGSINENLPTFVVLPNHHHQSELLAEAYRKASLDVKLHTVSGARHGWRSNCELNDLIQQFFDKHLKAE